MSYRFILSVLPFLLVVNWLAAAACAGAIAASKGRPFGAFLVLGLFAAPVALLAAIGLPQECAK